MQRAISHPTIPSEGTDSLEAAALRAEAWAGEPFLRPDEDAAEALAPDRARRQALDDAIAELEAGRREPSPEWKVRYALVLGLERAITDHPPRLKSGTELRRHQIDALAGLLTELIAKLEVGDAEENGNGNGEALRRRASQTAKRSPSSRPGTRMRSPRSRSRIPAPSAASASATRRPRARRSPQPGSSKAPARWASSSSRTAGSS